MHTCHIIFFGGGRAKNGASNWLRVCHTLGPPRLVLILTTNMVYCNFIDSVDNLKVLHIFDYQRNQIVTSLTFAHLKFHTFAIIPRQTHGQCAAKLCAGYALAKTLNPCHRHYRGEPCFSLSLMGGFFLSKRRFNRICRCMMMGSAQSCP